MAQQQWPQREEEILAFWERERIFEQSVEREALRGEFVFYDGPPTANAPPGMHHAEPQTYKDVIPRYRTMRGYRVRRKAGWDTHGLPVELQIEKKLGLKTKKDVEAYGIAPFNAACRDSVWEFKADWERLKHRMGSWMDMRNPYVTYEMPFIESVWWFLKQAWEKKLLTRDYKIVPWCPRCETPLSSHEVALGYQDDTEDPSVMVRFMLTAESTARMRVPEGTAFLVWTTTPWTLPGNGALAVHPEVEYAVVRMPGKNTEEAPKSPSAGSETHGTEGGLSPSDQDSTWHMLVKSGTPQREKSPTAGPEGNRTPKGKVTILPSAPAAGPGSAGQSPSYIILAKPLVERVLGADAFIERIVAGRELRGLRYIPLYSRIDRAAYPETYQVLDAEFVSMEDGTGIVHIASAYGEDDFTFKRRGIPPTFSVSEKGIMADGLPGAGKFAKEADTDIIEDLRSRELLFRDEKIHHTYPFCWRCSTPLLYFARSSWYITMSKLRSEIQAKNQTIHWLPEHIKDGRFGEWLRELKDWAITRERYWGAPVPIWECDRCGEREILGSFAELIAKAPKRNQFILMRHGEAESNARCIISSKLETSNQYPLTEAGRARVVKAAKQLQGAGITRIIASPFHRMQQTADIVSAAVGVPVTYDERLREIDLPDFDGKPCTDHDEVFAQDRTRHTLGKFTKKIGQNETWDELAKRMLTTLKSIDEQHEGQTILICTHGDPLFLLEWAFSGRTREGIEGMPYPTFDAPHAFAFTGALVNDRGELDAHRPFIDTISWPCTKAGCGGAMKRFLEVVDVWLESGCMPFAQHHYPFEKKESLLYPANYISEAIDQTRGWFYTLLAVATVLGWDAPYKNVIVLGHLLDAKGQKMSKSKGNVVNPIQLIDRYGADVVRWYMVAVNQAWDPKLFNEADLKSMSNKPFGTLRNLLSFWELHAGGGAPQWSSSNFSPSRSEGERPVPRSPEGEVGEGEGNSGELLDSWLRARTRQTYDAVTQHLDAYELTDAARAIGELVDDCSTWWLRRSRERLKGGDADARATFTAVLRSLAILLAPLAPFHAEHLWQTVNNFSPSSRGGARGGAASVHLASWDTAASPADEGDVTLLQQMSDVRRLCSLGLEARAKANVPVRQPLAVLRVPKIFSPAHGEGEREGVGRALTKLIADEVNVREVVEDSALKEGVSLDTTLTPELKREGIVRELTRAVNNLRKEMGLTPTDRIRVMYECGDADLTAAIAEHRNEIVRAVGASSFEISNLKSPSHTLTIASAKITLDIFTETH